MIIGERFRRTVEMASWPSRPVTVSVGVAALDTNFTNPTHLVQHADQALYRAKQSGRNRVSA